MAMIWKWLGCLGRYSERLYRGFSIFMEGGIAVVSPARGSLALIFMGTWNLCSRRAGDLLFLRCCKKSKQKNAVLYSLVLIKKL